MKESVFRILRHYGVFAFFIFTYLFVGFALIVFKCPGYVATITANICGLTLGIFGYRYLSKLDSQKSEEKLKDMKREKIGYIIVFCLFTIFANMSLSTYVVLRFANDVSNARSESVNDTPMVILLLLSCILAPITEEIMMRLFSYNLLKRCSNWIVSMCVTSFVFGALHGTYEHLISGFLFGVVSVLLYEMTGTIFASIIYHMLYNFMVLGVTEDMLMIQSPNFEILMFIYIIVIISTVFLLNKRIKKIPEN